ncbi:MAG: phytanoyl-CoA dioxygenase family protein, partial [Myxococcales bacterium]|nr:phytanoyl-CoA dioxygenase family protein [Myxococcales bacterium]
SETARVFVVHPIIRTVCDHFLLPNCPPGGRYQLHVSAAVEVGPGARRQALHREEDTFPFFALPRPNLVVATMWAISDFTADNGGTLLVPGSHRWEAGRRPRPEEVTSVEMEAGSVLFWLGGTLHGAGANTSDEWRYGVILTYSLGWLRQEENQSLAVPPAVARTLSTELLDMIGNTPNGALGIHAVDGLPSAEIENTAESLLE